MLITTFVNNELITLPTLCIATAAGRRLLSKHFHVPGATADISVSAERRYQHHFAFRRTLQTPGMSYSNLQQAAHRKGHASESNAVRLLHTTGKLIDDVRTVNV